MPIGKDYVPRLRDVVTPNGSVFFDSAATPAGTGAVADGGYVDTFRSQRSPAGWITTDLTAFSGTAFAGAPGDKELVAASANGSSALISTSLSLSPEDVDDPTNNVTFGRDLYLVGEDTAPLFVSHGDLPNSAPEIEVSLGPVFTNSDLSAVGFMSKPSLQTRMSGSKNPTPGCYLWSNAGTRLAFLTNPDEDAPMPGPNCRMFGVAADGRAIIEDTSGDTYTGRLFAAAGGEGFPIGGGATQLSGEQPGAASFVALSPNGESVYLTTTDKLTEEANSDSGADLYAVNMSAELGLFSGSAPQPPAVSCISCEAALEPNGGSVTYVGQSGDGSHVFFQLANGDVYEHDAAGTHELAPAVDGLEDLVFSENGNYAVAITSSSLSGSDTDGSSDVYLISGNAPPQLITSGEDAGVAYTPRAVSNSGQRVLYEEHRGQAEVIDEWSAGQVRQISPIGATQGYSVMAAVGSELENIFFQSHEPLAATDQNAGTQDIYDARVDGGFPAPTTSGGAGQTPNPTAPPVTPYALDLTPSTTPLGALAPDTSTLASAPKSKPMTKAQKLAKALKTCKKDHHRRKRRACEKSAHAKYGPKKVTK